MTQKSLFWSSYFLRADAFVRSSVFGTVTSLQQLVFQNNYSFGTKILPSSPFFRIGSSLGQLLFGTATFLTEEFLRIKISIEELFFRSSYFCTASGFPEELYVRKKQSFQQRNIPYYLLFLGEPAF